MLFTIPNKKYLSAEQVKTNTLLRAYFIIKEYPMFASDIILSNFLKTKYNISLKDMCIQLLLSLSFYEDADGNVILLFKNDKDDKLARLITYGNGAILGSRILKIALSA